jgi:hypothetical protein
MAMVMSALVEHVVDLVEVAADRCDEPDEWGQFAAGGPT